MVAWDGEPAQIRVRLPADLADRPVRLTVHLESGEERTFEATDLRVEDHQEVERATYVTRRAVVPDRMPLGYHRVHVEGEERPSLLVSAPRRATPAEGRRWGVFLPTHALRSGRSWGVGDFSDLHALGAWVRERGGDLVATLPPLATFLGTPHEPSPYAPVSRRFWNELLVDVTRAPELESSPDVRALVASDAVRRELRALRRRRLVDQDRAMALKRRVMEPLSAAVLAGDSPRRRAFEAFLQERPAVRDYARFRAACERQGAPWTGWSDPRGPRDADLDPRAVAYHCYAQWLAEEQLSAMEEHGLFLDLPLGVHPGGYDTWREGDLFADGVSTGSPPDSFSIHGQDWGFPPIHPRRSRERGHAYLIASVRHLLSHARALRIDHVMGLHRLLWVPEGMEATRGLYVEYPAEELYAILCLESHRRGAVIVGEDLGTVHPSVRPSMRKHGLLRNYVTQTEVFPDRTPSVRKVPRRAQASLNTHDMFPFAGFWEGHDIERRLELGLLDRGTARRERTRRRRARVALTRHLRREGFLGRGEPSTRGAFQAATAHLAASPARLVLLSLEDCWLEKEPQNVPGTTDEHPNWRRSAAHTLEEARRMPAVLDTLGMVDRLRRGEAR